MTKFLETCWVASVVFTIALSVICFEFLVGIVVVVRAIFDLPVVSWNRAKAMVDRS